MQLARFYTTLLFLISLSLFSNASPVATDLLVRGQGCKCGQDVVNALTALQVKVNADVKLLNGFNPCSLGIGALASDITAATNAMAQLDVSAGFAGADLNLCAQICVNMILAILAGCLKYSILAVLSAVGKLDSALCGLLNACIKLNANFLPCIIAKYVHANFDQNLNRTEHSSLLSYQPSTGSCAPQADSLWFGGRSWRSWRSCLKMR
ncbi:hypothetical protein DL93DRAFT_2080940 [Clavulina sp. PMI_390]|nr:hypothetical protein DL93DRAFT_2080940 [Clavulina sp. PMI_390]